MTNGQINRAESKFDKLSNEIAKDYEKKGKSKKEADKIGNATAYKIGVAKYGKRGMERKARAGRAMNAESFGADEKKRRGMNITPKIQMVDYTDVMTEKMKNQNMKDAESFGAEDEVIFYQLEVKYNIEDGWEHIADFDDEEVATSRYYDLYDLHPEVRLLEVDSDGNGDVLYRQRNYKEAEEFGAEGETSDWTEMKEDLDEFDDSSGVYFIPKTPQTHSEMASMIKEYFGIGGSFPSQGHFHFITTDGYDITPTTENDEGIDEPVFHIRKQDNERAWGAESFSAQEPSNDEYNCDKCGEVRNIDFVRVCSKCSMSFCDTCSSGGGPDKDFTCGEGEGEDEDICSDCRTPIPSHMGYMKKMGKRGLGAESFGAEGKTKVTNITNVGNKVIVTMGKDIYEGSMDDVMLNNYTNSRGQEIRFNGEEFGADEITCKKCVKIDPVYQEALDGLAKEWDNIGYPRDEIKCPSCGKRVIVNTYDAEEFDADGMDFKEAAKTGFGIAAGFTLFNVSLFGIAAVAGIVMSKK